MGRFVVERTVGAVVGLEKVKEEAMHILNDTYITFKGIYSLINMLVKHFVITKGDQQNLPLIKQHLILINQRTNCLFSRLYFIAIKLSLHMILLTCK